MRFGKKIKNLRLQLGLTQRELAERSDVTKGFISQMEHNLTSPSIDTLEKIVGALGITMAKFFEDTEVGDVIFPLSKAIRTRNDELKSEQVWIVPMSQSHSMEPMLVELEKKGRTKVYKPFEGECFGFVMQGGVTLVLGDERFDVPSQQSFYFEGTLPFSIENGDRKSKVLLISSPPVF